LAAIAAALIALATLAAIAAALIALATLAAVATRPAILLADEPTGNLDSRNSLAVLNILRDLNERLHQTILMITHNAEAAAFGHRILYMSDGRIIDAPA
jgi:putative ABC transport system ATP-binding protein